ncbi:MAG TPA: helix-turn-helix domain-containing protein [Candidatus Dormibacteraeota bacterium]
MSGPAITVKDVWRGALPEGTELLAGGGGLERRVEWACALRTRPPAFDAVKGGEIAFVPVRSIKMLDERLDLPQVMTSFAEKGGVAVAVLGAVSADSIDVADRLVMPLLRLPDAQHIADAHHGCVRFILDQRALLHERAQELQSSLMQLALSGAGAPVIVDSLAEVTKLDALWLDAHGTVCHTAGRAPDAAAAVATAHVPALRRWGDTIAMLAADPPVRELEGAAGDPGMLASPIPGRQGVAGYVAVVGPPVQLDQVARMATARAASACAIELDRERAVTETRDRLEGEFIESLLVGSYTSEDAALERALRLGLDLSKPFAVASARGSRTDPGFEDTALRAVRSLVAHRGVNALVSGHAGSVCLILLLEAFADETSLSRLVEAMRAECARAAQDTGTSLGIGRPHTGVVGVRTSFREAEQALAMGRRVLGPGRVVSFADLGLHRLLFAVSGQQELADFYEDTVGPLVAYDRRTGADLMATLDAFFLCLGSPTETAQRMHLHRNTVLYRLRRIEEIGGLKLDDAATRLNLQLCLRIRDVLHVSDQRGAPASPASRADFVRLAQA